MVCRASGNILYNKATVWSQVCTGHHLKVIGYNQSDTEMKTDSNREKYNIKLGYQAIQHLTDLNKKSRKKRSRKRSRHE